MKVIGIMSRPVVGIRENATFEENRKLMLIRQTVYFPVPIEAGTMKPSAALMKLREGVEVDGRSQSSRKVDLSKACANISTVFSGSEAPWFDRRCGGQAG